jgi:tetratricopeptide (TPR) repeat protein
MKIIFASCVIVCAASAWAGNSPPSQAENAIAEARKAILEKPEGFEGYNRLAAALLLRARETADSGYCTQAGDYVEKSLKLAKDNFEGGQIRTSILLCRHEYREALEAAKTLNKRIPDDVMTYGLLVDANTELGLYKDAETAGQWMLNLRPGNLPALIHAAHLRELFGDLDGSEELMSLAYQSTSPAEGGQRAAILAYMGHLRLRSGMPDAAEKVLMQALTALPDYPEALRNLAEVRIAQKRYEEAVTLRRQVSQMEQRAGALYDLAEALELAGHPDEAQKTFTDFEAKALLESKSKDNADRKLILYYADRAREPAKALELAKQEYSWRQDVFTLDAYAWALHVNGDDIHAREQIKAALAVGIRDPLVARHAAEIGLRTSP